MAALRLKQRSLDKAISSAGSWCQAVGVRAYLDCSSSRLTALHFDSLAHTAHTEAPSLTSSPLPLGCRVPKTSSISREDSKHPMGLLFRYSVRVGDEGSIDSVIHRRAQSSLHTCSLVRLKFLSRDFFSFSR